MALTSLYTNNFRNLIPSKIELNSDINIVLGQNGSGKSSLLEALFLLGHGKSFRTNKFSDIVNIDDISKTFIVSGKTELNEQLGIQRNLVSGDSLYKVNGQKQDRLSEFVQKLAIQIITPESFKLFFGGPKERRKYLDLGLFHVEQSFGHHWKTFSKVLSQRNSCLRNKVKGEQITYWNEAFCHYSEVLTNLRVSYVETLKDEIAFWLAILLPSVDHNISIEFNRGWHQKKSLAEVLASSLQKEYIYGHSMYGAQKFDLKFLISNRPIEAMLSRGQQKLFLLVLTLAQSSLIKKVKQIKPILLIDDIGAELDQESRAKLAESIEVLDCQIVITAIEQTAVAQLMQTQKKYKLFHVKHGDVSEINEY